MRQNNLLRTVKELLEYHAEGRPPAGGAGKRRVDNNMRGVYSHSEVIA